ncbi:MAG TPA: metal ABC transporter substrate-binding protein [Candidatus Hydrogenedentes bacterium]|nr:metal ABC transporter substrate-binding protein [Candidatus Hydrogenedentota bacterium]
MRRAHPPFLALLAAALLAACGAVAAPDGMVAGTAHLANAVADITGMEAVPFVLLPPAQCPGHYDARPGDIARLSEAGVVLLHTWQRPMGNVRRALEAAAVSPERIITVSTPGNWMVPETLQAGLHEVAEILARLHPDRSEAFRAAAEKRAQAVAEHARAARERVAAAGGASLPVAVNEMQAPLVKWAGLTAPVVFGRGEEMGAAELAALVGDARKAGVRAVVNNLQSGNPKAAETLAAELGVPLVTLSNFPGADPDAPSWETTLDRNLDRLLDALKPSTGTK